MGLLVCAMALNRLLAPAGRRRGRSRGRRSPGMWTAAALMVVVGALAGYFVVR